MEFLLPLAAKSLLIAGATLGLLALLRHRSAAERSWVAHIGLLALVIMAFAPLVLPSWTVEAPALLGQDAAVPQLSVEAKAPAAAASPSIPAAAADAPLAAAPAFANASIMPSPEAVATVSSDGPWDLGDLASKVERDIRPKADGLHPSVFMAQVPTG